jgi:hypothetical protein
VGAGERHSARLFVCEQFSPCQRIYIYGRALFFCVIWLVTFSLPCSPNEPRPSRATEIAFLQLAFTPRSKLAVLFCFLAQLFSLARSLAGTHCFVPMMINNRQAQAVNFFSRFFRARSVCFCSLTSIRSLAASQACYGVATCERRYVHTTHSTHTAYADIVLDWMCH